MFSSVGLWGPMWAPKPTAAELPFKVEKLEGARPLIELEAVSVRENGVASILENGAMELMDPDLSSDLCAASALAAAICLKLSAERGPDTDGWRMEPAIDLLLPEG